MKKLMLASFIGMIFFQSCTKENNILPVKEQLNQNLLKRKTTANQNETPPIYIPQNETAVR
jgi:hypothetical protein